VSRQSSSYKKNEMKDRKQNILARKHLEK